MAKKKFVAKATTSKQAVQPKSTQAKSSSISISHEQALKVWELIQVCQKNTLYNRQTSTRCCVAWVVFSMHVNCDEPYTANHCDEYPSKCT